MLTTLCIALTWFERAPFTGLLQVTGTPAIENRLDAVTAALLESVRKLAVMVVAEFSKIEAGLTEARNTKKLGTVTVPDVFPVEPLFDAHQQFVAVMVVPAAAEMVEPVGAVLVTKRAKLTLML